MDKWLADNPESRVICGYDLLYHSSKDVKPYWVGLMPGNNPKAYARGDSIEEAFNKAVKLLEERS